MTESNLDKSLSDDLKEVQIRIAQAKTQLSLLNNRQRDLLIEISVRKTGLRLGTNILLNGKEGVISGYDNYISPLVTWRKKDGTFGTRQTALYSWDLANIKIIN